jgi:hypothetical protein
MGFFTQMLSPDRLAQLSLPPQKGLPMTNADRALMSSLTTQLCDALDALADALREVRDELRASQTEPGTWERATREHVLVPPSPPPLPGPSL